MLNERSRRVRRFRSRRSQSFRWIVGAGTVLVLPAATLAGAAGVASASPAASPVGRLAPYVDTVVAQNSNASNGDTNPYGIAVIPKTAGSLVAGNLLVAEFNNSAGTSGAGTSLVQVNPTTGSVTDFATAAQLGNSDLTGPVDIAINPSNDFVWVGDFGASATGSQSNYLVLSPTGGFVAVETNASVSGNSSLSASAQPFAGVWGAAVGVDPATSKTAFYWTNIAGTASPSGTGEVWRTNPGGPNLSANSSFTPLAVGLPASASGLTGPKGLVYDPNNGVLYFTDSMNNTIYAIANAATATGPVTPQVVLQGGPLSQPQDLALDPVNGKLFVVNGAAGPGTSNAIIELTTSGHVVGVRDLAPTESAGGLFGIAATMSSAGVPTLYYDNANDSNVHALMLPSSSGYDMVARDGGVFTQGHGGFFGSAGNIRLNSPIVGGAPAVGGSGYYLVAADGGVFTYGSAPFFGSLGAMHLSAPIVGMATTPDGMGYWLVGSNGQVYAFGDAKLYGSLAAMHLSAPIVGMATTPDGMGYYLVARDGGVFTFGDATFFGSLGAMHLNAPIVAMATTPNGMGYYLVGADGGVFTFGDATFFGSLGAMHLNAPVVGIAPTANGRGYALIAADGGVFNFGNSVYFGSEGAQHLNAPVVGGFNVVS